MNMLTTVVVSAVCGGLAGYLTTYARIRYEIARNARQRKRVLKDIRA